MPEHILPCSSFLSHRPKLPLKRTFLFIYIRFYMWRVPTDDSMHTHTHTHTTCRVWDVASRRFLAFLQTMHAKRHELAQQQQQQQQSSAASQPLSSPPDLSLPMPILFDVIHALRYISADLQPVLIQMCLQELERNIKVSTANEVQAQASGQPVVVTGVCWCVVVGLGVCGCVCVCVCVCVGVWFMFCFDTGICVCMWVCYFMTQKGDLMSMIS